MRGEADQWKNVNRWIFYILGMVVLAAGITLNTKTGLGVSPIISVAYCVSQIFELNFGDMTFVLYGIFVVVQLFLRERRERLATLLRFPREPGVQPAAESVQRLHPLSGGGPQPAGKSGGAGPGHRADGGGGWPSPSTCGWSPTRGHGIVQAVAQRMGRDQGFAKNVFDLGLRGSNGVPWACC